MTLEEFRDSLAEATPAPNLPAPLCALWWDAHGDWPKAHAQVDDLNTPQAVAVHAYLHRREGDVGNATYWYRRAGHPPHGGSLDAEWAALACTLLGEEEQR